MPWCDPCAKYWAPNAMNEDGTCPDCHKVLATRSSMRMEARSLGVPGPGQEVGQPPKAPWHFKLTMVGLAVYLGWRVVQGVEWIIHR